MEAFGYPPQELLFLAPEILLATAGLLLLLRGTRGRGFSGREASLVAGASLVLAGWLVLRVQASLEGRESLALLGGLFVLDGLSFLVQLLVLLAALFTVLLSVPPRAGAGEGSLRDARSSALLLLATAGLLVLASGTDLLVLWIALEAAAVTSGLLRGPLRRPSERGTGRLASLLPEALASGLVLAGLALLWGAAGTLRLDDLGRVLAEPPSRGTVLIPLAWWLVAAGLFFRIAAVPLRVCRLSGETALSIVAFLTTAFRTAAFALLLRVLHAGPGSGAFHWQPVAAALAAAALIGSSLAALARHGTGRMLAAGSLAQIGFLLTSLLVAGGAGLPTVLFYLLASTFAILGAYGAAVLHERSTPAGSARCGSVPASAATLLFLLALAGLPPTGGFVGQLCLVAAALRGWAWLAALGALASAFLLAGTLRLLTATDRGRAEPETAAPPRAPAVVAAVAVCAAMTLALGLAPGPVLEWMVSLGLAAGN